jgi:hypothetical protein
MGRETMPQPELAADVFAVAPDGTLLRITSEANQLPSNGHGEDTGLVHVADASSVELPIGSTGERRQFSAEELGPLVTALQEAGLVITPKAATDSARQSRRSKRTAERIHPTHRVRSAALRLGVAATSAASGHFVYEKVTDEGHTIGHAVLAFKALAESLYGKLL